MTVAMQRSGRQTLFLKKNPRRTSPPPEKKRKADQQIAEREGKQIEDKRTDDSLKRAEALKKAQLQKQQDNERTREREAAGRKRKRDVATAPEKKRKAVAHTLAAISVLSLVARSFLAAGWRGASG